MLFKGTISKFIVFTVVLFSVFYIFNFVTDKKDALANINNKQIVEVLDTLMRMLLWVCFIFRRRKIQSKTNRYEKPSYNKTKI